MICFHRNPLYKRLNIINPLLIEFLKLVYTDEYFHFNVFLWTFGTRWNLYDELVKAHSDTEIVLQETFVAINDNWNENVAFLTLFLLYFSQQNITQPKVPWKSRTLTVIYYYNKFNPSHKPISSEKPCDLLGWPNWDSILTKNYYFNEKNRIYLHLINISHIRSCLPSPYNNSSNTFSIRIFKIST